MVLDFVEQILSALLNIHLKAYVHRDLKPANLLVRDRQGGLTGKEVVIADFGLSR